MSRPPDVRLEAAVPVRPDVIIGVEALQRVVGPDARIDGQMVTGFANSITRGLF
jgi:hypothetical protein